IAGLRGELERVVDRRRAAAATGDRAVARQQVDEPGAMRQLDRAGGLGHRNDDLLLPALTDAGKDLAALHDSAVLKTRDNVSDSLSNLALNSAADISDRAHNLAGEFAEFGNRIR